MSEKVEILTVDDLSIHAEIYGVNHNTCLIINPAIGVKRKMYRAFAEFMAAQGTTCVVYNYRGMEDGMDQLETSKQQDAVSWGRIDQHAVIDWVKSKLSPERLLLMGHSIGGQLFGFAENHTHVDGLIHVASQKGDWRLWPLRGRLKLMLLWYVLIPLMSRSQKFHASKLGLGTYPWPAPAARQWASWGQQRGYLFNPKFGFDLNPWHNFNKPLLSLGFTDDAMAPPKAIEGLLTEFGKNHDQGHIDKRIINPKNYQLRSVGHFGFFKPEAKTIWQDMVKWIQQQKK